MRGTNTEFRISDYGPVFLRQFRESLCHRHHTLHAPAERDSKPEVAFRWLKDMLLMPLGDLVAHGSRLPFPQRTNAVGNDTVLSPITAPDHIACSGGCDAGA